MDGSTKKINEKLKRQRELRGWSQAALAQEIGTVRQVVCRWEKGETLENISRRSSVHSLS